MVEFSMPIGRKVLISLLPCQQFQFNWMIILSDRCYEVEIMKGWWRNEIPKTDIKRIKLWDV